LGWPQAGFGVTSASPLLQASLPRVGDDDMRFAEPWEAKAFAIVVKLAESGAFTWAEWVACFSQEVAAATSTQACGKQPPSYYEQWLVAAEKLAVAKGLTSTDQLAARRFALGASGPTHQLR
jgi:nitrile hydratase accessory protein